MSGFHNLSRSFCTALLSSGALALCSASAPASAEPTAFHNLSSDSSIRVGGVIDMTFMGQKADGMKHTFEMSSNQDETSRIFMRGRENLSNGNYLRFLLQSSFAPDTGNFYNQGVFFGQSMVALGGNWGEFALGRIGAMKSPNGDYSQFFEFGGISPIHGNIPYGGVGYTFLTDGYLNNALVYKSPEVGPFRFGLQYSNGTMDETGEFGNDNKLLTFATRYKFGNLRGGLMLTWQTHGQQEGNQNAKINDTYDLFFAVNYRFPKYALKLAYQYVYDGFGPGPFLNWSHFGLKPTNGRGFDTQALMLGIEFFPTGADSIGFALQGNRTEYKGNSPAADDGDTTGWRINPALIWRHKLSKHLAVYSAVTWSHGTGVYDRIDNSNPNRSTRFDRVNVTTYGAGMTYFF